MPQPRDGLDGLSAFEIARLRGFQGTDAEWLESLKGEPGRDGADGEPGKSVDPAEVDALVRRAVEAIPRPRDGINGQDGKRGEKGEPGDNAKPPPAVPYVATFTRDPETQRTLSMYVEPKSGNGQAWSVIPRPGRDGVWAEVEINPL